MSRRNFSFMTGMLKTGLITGVASMLFALSALNVKGQTTEAAKLAVNRPVALTAKHNDSENNASTPSTDLLQSQIKAQKLEINELQERVKKLGSMLEALTANQMAHSATPATMATPAAPVDKIQAQATIAAA